MRNINCIDWNKFIFISKGDLFVKNSESFCKLIYNTYKLSDTVEDTLGLFVGVIYGNNDKVRGVNEPKFCHNDLIVNDELNYIKIEDACRFNDFDVYYNGVIVNELSYLELFKLSESID